MAKIRVVNSAWTKRRAFLMGAVVAAVSIALWAGLDQWNEAWDYQMPDLLFAPLFFGIVLIYPVVALVTFYRRLPGAILGLTYSLGYGVGWHAAMWALQAAEFGKSLSSIRGFLSWQVRYLPPTVAVCVAIGMAIWGVCRLARGRVLIQDGTLCGKCGYSLVGNVSGICPECGTKFREGSPAQSASSDGTGWTVDETTL